MVKKLRSLKLIAVLALFVAVTLLGFTGCGNGEEDKGKIPEKDPKEGMTRPIDMGDGLIYDAVTGDPIHDNFTETSKVTRDFCADFPCVFPEDGFHMGKTTSFEWNEYKRLYLLGIDVRTPEVGNAIKADSIQFHKDLPEHQR